MKYSESVVGELETRVKELEEIKRDHIRELVKLQNKVARLEYEAQDDPRKTGEWDAMEKRCADLEQELANLKQVVLKYGLNN